MQSLHDLQSQFVHDLIHNSEDIFLYIRSSEKLSAKEHLAIYQSSIFGAKQKVLNEIYTVCNKLVGEEFFIAMINEYIPTTISRAPDIADYGADFSDFIADFQPAKSLPYLADVARLEWAWHRIFYARPLQEIDFQKLAECYQNSGDKIIFSLPLDSFLIFSPYPIHQIWEVNQNSYTGDQTVLLPVNEKFYYLVWRKESEMRIDLLNDAEWQILNWIQANFTLSEISERMISELPHVNLEEVLPTMVSKRWLADFNI